MTLTTIKKAGLDELALDHIFTVGASGTDHYTFQGEGLNGTVNDPTLYLTRGKTYRFEKGSAHPLRIQSTSGASGTAYNTGVTNNGGTGTVIMEVQHDAPDTLYYQCTSHANMNGIIYVTGALSGGSVTEAKIANNAVTTNKLANSAVTTAKIADDAVTNAKVADNAVNTSQLVDGSVTTAKIADDAVTSAKIASNSVTNDAINNDSIHGDKLTTQTISLAKLVHGTSDQDGKFLRANNGADPTFESLPASGVTVGNAADERVVTSDGTNLDAESLFVYRAAKNGVGIGTATPEPTASYYEGAFLHIHQAASGGSVGSQLHLTTDNTGSAAGDGSQISAYSSSLYINNQENGDTYFYNNGSSNLTIKANGNVGIGTQSPSDKLHVNGTATIGSNLYLSNNTYIASNKGIYFDGGTGSANHLDDYEEGTFTPNFSYSTLQNNFTHTEQSGQYTKIGNCVFFHLRLNISDKGSGSGNLKINGLPFNVYSGTIGNQQVIGTPIVDMDLGGDRELFVQFEGSGTSLFCYSFAIESSNNYAVVGSGNIGNGLNFSVQGHYFTSS